MHICRYSGLKDAVSMFCKFIGPETYCSAFPDRLISAKIFIDAVKGRL